MHPAAEAYQALLERIDRWFGATRERHPGIVPCRPGCSACCHGPFDISAADALLLRQGLATLTATDLGAVRDRAEEGLARLRQAAPEWGPPWDVRALGEERFDAVSEALADLPCPLLDDAGACRLYRWRPMVCRLIGLPMLTAEGEILANACPIQDDFPRYAALDPQPFDLEALEAEEVAALEAASLELLGRLDPGFETTVAGAVGGARSEE
jgi:Fe-S-cluster containining protein